MCSKKQMPGPGLQSQTTRRLHLHDNLIFDEILTRLPPPTVVRCRAVCRSWHTALTSDDFVRAYAAARSSSSSSSPELFFFPPAADDATATSTSTTLYACALRHGEPPLAARELLTLGNLSAAAHVSPRPCHGLTLVSVSVSGDGPAAERRRRHYVCNLSTGQHVALPPPPPCCCDDADDERAAASIGLGFDPAAGEHKAVRLFRKRRTGETACEVCSCVPAGQWRRVPSPSAASFVPGQPPVYLRGSLYWLLQMDRLTGTEQPIMSLTVGGGERFGFVRMPPLLARRVGALTELDGALCAVVDLRFDNHRYALFTWTSSGDGSGDGEGSSAAWSMRYAIDLRRLPKEISEEFAEEKDVLPLCTCSGSAADGGGRRLLLATGFHKVFAYEYDPTGRRVECMERVMCLQEFVDVPAMRQRARESFFLHFGLYQDSIASVGGDGSGLQVKLGVNTVAKRQVFHAYRNPYSRRVRDTINALAREFKASYGNIP